MLERVGVSERRIRPDVCEKVSESERVCECESERVSVCEGE